MPNAKTHIKVGMFTGLASGAILNLIDQDKRTKQDPSAKFDWKEFLAHCALGYATGAIGGILPDILEPAYHSHHRNVCHSLGTLALTGIGAVKAGKHHMLNPYLKTIAVAGCVSYASHLILDGGTPRGVPLLLK